MPPKTPGGNVNRGPLPNEVRNRVHVEPSTMIDLLRPIADIFGPDIEGKDILNIVPTIIFLDENATFRCYHNPDRIWLTHPGAHQTLAEDAKQPKFIPAYLLATTFKGIILFPHLIDVESMAPQAALAKMRDDFEGRARVERGGLTSDGIPLDVVDMLTTMPEFLENAYRNVWDFQKAQWELRLRLEQFRQQMS